MAHFYTSTNNSRGKPVTAGGTAQSGQITHARGWNGGIKVYASVDAYGGDVFRVYRTGGSNGGAEHWVGDLRGEEWIPA